jgi:hypothetical protein
MASTMFVFVFIDGVKMQVRGDKYYHMDGTLNPDLTFDAPDDEMDEWFNKIEDQIKLKRFSENKKPQQTAQMAKIESEEIFINEVMYILRGSKIFTTCGKLWGHAIGSEGQFKPLYDESAWNETIEKAEQVEDNIEPIVEEKEGCCICFVLTENKTDCNHIVCVDCMTKLTKKICPLCRTKFPVKPESAPVKPAQYFTQLCPIEIERLKNIQKIGILQKEIKEFEKQSRFLHYYGEGGIDFERLSLVPRNDACRHYLQICEERLVLLRENRRR